MKWPRVRFTVRRMMTLVLLLGVAAHLGIAAWRVYWMNDRHVHNGIIDNPNLPFPSLLLMTRRRPFWPSYSRALLGRSWKDWPLGRPLCQAEPDVILERCEIAHPEMRGYPGTNTFSARVTKEQAERYVQLARKRGSNTTVDYDQDGNPSFHTRAAEAKH